ncbi:MAG: ABC transporter ATP-binding protein [Acidobacteriales bacterium]|nr:ABC transporter ATP-binding protein [Terriglobales bacterium]
MDAALSFQDLTKDYRKWPWSKPFRALDGFTLNVNRGEIFGFLGPNGSGKTTSIHIALGLTRATRGSGTMLGQPFGHVPTRRRIGFLAENVAYHHITASKLVKLHGALNGVPGPLLRDRTKELLQAVDLEEVTDKPTQKFSRGMVQRVGLAIAMINDPELLVLDEPTSALDPAARVQVRELLLEARRQGKTIFLSSHLLSEIELICDRIGILHRGRLIRLGTISELLEERDRFEIRARNLAGGPPEGAVAENGFVTWTVPAAAQRAAIERVWAAGGELISVTPSRKNLEQVFLELTGKDSTGGPQA